MDTTKDDNKYLVFELGNQYFATPLLSINEVIKPLEITPVTSDTPFFKGAINLRGEVIGIIDLRTLFQVEEKEGPELSYLIFETSKGTLGAIVDRVHSVIPLTEQELQKNWSIETSKKFKFLQGIAKTDNYLITVIDMANLSEREISVDISEIEPQATNIDE